MDSFDDNCYYLEVKRKEDGVVTRTCDFCPGGGTAVENVVAGNLVIVPTLVDAGGDIMILQQLTNNMHQMEVNVYTLAGLLIER